MGSSSDSRIMHGAAEILDSFSIPHEDQIISAHRTPERLNEYAKHAEKSKFKVIIAGAGGAAHLPGMIASHTTIPVIGVPIMVYNDKQMKKTDKNKPCLTFLKENLKELKKNRFIIKDMKKSVKPNYLKLIKE